MPFILRVLNFRKSDLSLTILLRYTFNCFGLEFYYSFYMSQNIIEKCKYGKLHKIDFFCNFLFWHNFNCTENLLDCYQKLLYDLYLECLLWTDVSFVLCTSSFSPHLHPSHLPVSCFRCFFPWTIREKLETLLEMLSPISSECPSVYFLIRMLSYITTLWWSKSGSFTMIQWYYLTHTPYSNFNNGSINVLKLFPPV